MEGLPTTLLWSFLLWICLLWGVVWGTTTDNPSNLTYLERFVQMKNSRDYDYQLAPIDTKGNAIVADVGIYINNIGEISEVNMEYSINIYFRQLWIDYRLAFEDEIPEVDSIAIPDGYYQDIWTPDTFIENGKEERMHSVTKDNKGIRIYKDGRIFYSQRLTLTLWCQVYLEDFPMDTQVCQLRMMSYRYTTSEMILQWLTADPVENADVELPMFTLEKTEYGDCTTGFSTGAYTCAFVKFTFRRLLSYYLAQIYVPSVLIIVLSWVSFWLDPLAVPGRISLGVLTILTMTNQMSTAASSSLPKVSYVKSIDIWLTTCLCFLFAGLMEFAIVNSLARKPGTTPATPPPNEEKCEEADDGSLVISYTQVLGSPTQPGQQAPHEMTPINSTTNTPIMDGSNINTNIDQNSTAKPSQVTVNPVEEKNEGGGDNDSVVISHGRALGSPIQPGRKAAHEMTPISSTFTTNSGMDESNIDTDKGQNGIRKASHIKVNTVDVEQGKQGEKDNQWVVIKFFQDRLTASGVDRASRILFPLAFLIFNFGYWMSNIKYFTRASI